MVVRIIIISELFIAKRIAARDVPDFSTRCHHRLDRGGLAGRDSPPFRPMDKDTADTWVWIGWDVMAFLATLLIVAVLFGWL